MFILILIRPDSIFILINEKNLSIQYSAYCVIREIKAKEICVFYNKKTKYLLQDGNVLRDSL